MNERQSSVELRIDELVLHGFAPGDRYRMAEALAAELTRIFTEQGAPPGITRNSEIAHLDCGTLQLEPNSDSHEISVRAARAIYGGFAG